MITRSKLSISVSTFGTFSGSMTKPSHPHTPLQGHRICLLKEKSSMLYKGCARDKTLEKKVIPAEISKSCVKILGTWIHEMVKQE
ncbi:unnamed protein product [Dibothriocephalus latus]|uniref:Uncharacterized protein n=1 Tax=Dibothriocephalus latus TaxID=60516 RepID=A0A3P7LTM1_DIBLA|nr:unnamed protein product [Dibothriocephalus latus]